MPEVVNAAVLYASPFVPPEWIDAHRMKPVRVMPDATDKSPSRDVSAGVCPYARAFSSAVANEPGASVIVDTLCDQMRRYSELIGAESGKRIFLMNVPRTWETPAANKLYIDELRRLGRFLVTLGGETPSDEKLVRTILRWDAARSTIFDARSSITPREFAEAWAQFGRTGEPIIPPSKSIGSRVGIPLALVGGPMLSEHFRIFDLIRQSGGFVALDATSTGERSIPGKIDRRRVREDALQTLADAYFGTIPDAARRPNSMLYRWLKDRIAEEGIRGVIFLRYVWCDTWHAEAQRMKDWLGLPFFDLDISEDVGDASRRLTRFQAFMEMLR